MAHAMSEFDHRYNMLIQRFASEPDPPFESAAEQQATWGRRWGCTDDVGRRLGGPAQRALGSEIGGHLGSRSGMRSGFRA